MSKSVKRERELSSETTLRSDGTTAVIPKPIRNVLDIESGDELVWAHYGSSVRVENKSKMSVDELLDFTDPGEEGGNRTLGHSKVHSYGNQTSIIKKARDTLDIEAGDGILWVFSGTDVKVFNAEKDR